MEGLIHGGAYFRNFTVFNNENSCLKELTVSSVALTSHRNVSFGVSVPDQLNQNQNLTHCFGSSGTLILGLVCKDSILSALLEGVKFGTS